MTSFFDLFSIFVNNHLLALLLTNTYCSSKYYFGETGGKLCSRSRSGESNGAKGKGGRIGSIKSRVERIALLWMLWMYVLNTALATCAEKKARKCRHHHFWSRLLYSLVFFNTFYDLYHAHDFFQSILHLKPSAFPIVIPRQYATYFG